MAIDFFSLCPGLFPNVFSCFRNPCAHYISTISIRKSEQQTRWKMSQGHNVFRAANMRLHEQWNSTSVHYKELCVYQSRFDMGNPMQTNWQVCGIINGNQIKLYCTRIKYFASAFYLWRFNKIRNVITPCSYKFITNLCLVILPVFCCSNILIKHVDWFQFNMNFSTKHTVTGRQLYTISIITLIFYYY